MLHVMITLKDVTVMSALIRFIEMSANRLVTQLHVCLVTVLAVELLIRVYALL